MTFYSPIRDLMKVDRVMMSFNFPHNCLNKHSQIDLVRDLGLTKEKIESLGSRLKEIHLFESGILWNK